MPTQHDANLAFIASKGFDTSSLTSLQKALHWLRTTDGDNLMYGEPTGEKFDKMVGEKRAEEVMSVFEKHLGV